LPSLALEIPKENALALKSAAREDVGSRRTAMPTLTQDGPAQVASTPDRLAQPATRPHPSGASAGLRVPTLDGLRALSIGMVFLSHQFYASPVMEALGPMGVRVFFVISGFIITLLLLKEDAETGAVSLRQFYTRRTLRIFPPCFAYLLAVALLTLAGKIRGIGATDFVHAVTYTVNYEAKPHWVIGHLWSLGVEEQFYLLWPLAFAFLSMRAGRRLLIACIIVVPSIRLAAVAGLIPAASLGRSFHTVADGLATGCLLAHFREVPAFRSLIARIPHAAAGAVFLAGIAGAIAWKLAHAPSAAVLAPTLANLAIALFVAKETRPSESLAFRLLNLRWVTQVGLWSYSLYLWQQPFLFHFSTPAIYHIFPYNYAIVFALALGSYYLIEKPSLRLRRYLL
jgi:peptidoglycan/LPS O-acetylase OafA/YrhL